MGHAEPAAGAVGIAHAAGMLTQRRRTALTHLRALNPLILSGARSGARLALPRQAAAAVVHASANAQWEAVQCVSAFAFQGTNAHAVLCASSAAARSGAGSMHAATRTSWRRQRHWYLGPMHQLLLAAGVSAHAGPEASFQTPLARAHLGALLPACMPLSMHSFTASAPASSAHFGWSTHAQRSSYDVACSTEGSSALLQATYMITASRGARCCPALACSR